MSASAFADQVVLITGGSRGIEISAAKALGNLGATVLLVRISPDNLARAVAQLRS